MALPSSGQLSFSQIAEEFDDFQPNSMSEYRRGGDLVPDAPPNASITNQPSGQRSFSNYYGATAEIVVFITGVRSGGVIADNEFTPVDWASATPKRLIIDDNAVIGSTNNGIAALRVLTTPGGKLTIDNRGRIYGASGPRGNSNKGGDAILLSANTTIINAGQIYGGGGSGARGGNGGSGNCTGPCTNPADYPACCPPPNACNGCNRCQNIPRLGVRCGNFRGVCFGQTRPGPTSPGGGGGGPGGAGQGFVNLATLYYNPAESGQPGSGGSGCPGGYSGSGGAPGFPGGPGFPWGRGNGGFAIRNSPTFLAADSVLGGSIIGEENQP